MDAALHTEYVTLGAFNYKASDHIKTTRHLPNWDGDIINVGVLDLQIIIP
jgi:hypothetical protein